MYSSKLLRQLKVLDTAEWKKLSLLAASPYYCVNPEVSRLINLLNSYRGRWEHMDLQKDRFFALMWPDQPFVARKLFDLRAEAVKLVELLWALTDFESRPAEKFFATSKRSLQKGLIKDFELNSRKMRRQLQNDSSSEQLLLAFQLEKLHDGYFGQSSSRHIDRSLQARMDRLDEFYLLEKLKGTCEMLNRNRILQEPYEIQFADSFSEIIANNRERFKTVPEIQMWFRVFQMLQDPDDQQHFELLQKDLETIADEVPASAIKEIYAYAQNHCIRKANAGHEIWNTSLFELYKQGLRTKILIEQGELSQSSFKNIVTVALRLKEFEWTSEFIEKYGNILPLQIQHNAVTYNRANYHYSKGDFDDALLLLREVEFDDVFYNLGAKTMLLKIYFEVEEFELLQSHIAAFRIYLKRNKTISADQNAAYRNMINLTQQMARIRNRAPYTSAVKTKQDLKKVDLAVNSGKPVMNVGWVRGVLEGLAV